MLVYQRVFDPLGAGRILQRQGQPALSSDLPAQKWWGVSRAGSGGTLECCHKLVVGHGYNMLITR